MQVNMKTCTILCRQETWMRVFVFKYKSYVFITKELEIALSVEIYSTYRNTLKILILTRDYCSINHDTTNRTRIFIFRADFKCHTQLA